MINFTKIVLVIVISISVVTPSCMHIWTDHFDIELVQDLGEEDQKESQNEVDSIDSFFEVFTTPKIAFKETTNLNAKASIYFENAFMVDIHLPPPECTKA